MFNYDVWYALYILLTPTTNFRRQGEHEQTIVLKTDILKADGTFTQSCIQSWENFNDTIVEYYMTF